VDGFGLGHHLVVDVKPAGSINNQNIDQPFARLLARICRYLRSRSLGVGREKFSANLSGELLQLLNGRGPVDVRAGKHDFFLVALNQAARELRAAGGFA
jgi:hypothetical protein